MSNTKVSSSFAIDRLCAVMGLGKEKELKKENRKKERKKERKNLHEIFTNFEITNSLVEAFAGSNALNFAIVLKKKKLRNTH